MDDLVRDLSSRSTVLDLGAGGGSFAYQSTPARVIAADVSFPSGSQTCFAQVIASSEAIPLRDSSVDVVVCNHSLEHFEKLQPALLELNRVIKPGSYLWVAVPDGFSFDDRLYRFLFQGGGHVNRFSFQSLVETIESGTELQALRYKKLHSGFVYLNSPDPENLIHYPSRAQPLARVPRMALETMLRWMNYFVRLMDRWTGSSLSHYGWGVVFRRSDLGSQPQATNLDQLDVIPEDINICFFCGAGHPVSTLIPRLKHFLFWKVYQCGTCGKENFFFQ